MKQGRGGRLALIEDAAKRLAKVGAAVRDVKLPPELAGLNDAHRWISSFEFARTFTWDRCAAGVTAVIRELV